MIKRILLIFFTAVFFTITCSGCDETKDLLDYGVFIGADFQKLSDIPEYKTIIIDAQNLTKEEIAEIKNANCEIYSYLNIGSIENFREYYAEYKQFSLGNYENWEEEKWIDVSEKKWQDFIIEELSAKLVEKGVDGFFIDNIDVYENFTTKEIFNGIINILQVLKAHNKKIIINGGDVFLREAIAANSLPNGLIDGINQECVFTEIDFEKEIFNIKSGDSQEYYKEYLSICKKEGINVYIIEYIDKFNKKILAEIRSYCDENNFKFYIANSLSLD